MLAITLATLSFEQPTASKDVDLRAVKVPPVIFLERPFMVGDSLVNIWLGYLARNLFMFFFHNILMFMLLYCLTCKIKYVPALVSI